MNQTYKGPYHPIRGIFTSLIVEIDSLCFFHVFAGGKSKFNLMHFSTTVFSWCLNFNTSIFIFVTTKPTDLRRCEFFRQAGIICTVQTGLEIYDMLPNPLSRFVLYHKTRFTKQTPNNFYFITLHSWFMDSRNTICTSLYELITRTSILNKPHRKITSELIQESMKQIKSKRIFWQISVCFLTEDPSTIVYQ